MKDDFILKIQVNYNRFTKAEKKVADFVISNTKDVLFMSINDLAEACGVGETSVFRFCKTMELQGYQEFKMQLSLSSSKTESTGPSSRIADNNSFLMRAKTALEQNQNAIKETYSLLDEVTFMRAVGFIEKAKNIYFFGVGGSMNTSLEGMIKFLKIMPRVYCIQDTHMQTMTASMLGEGDLAIITSYSGSTKDMVQVASLAKAGGAKVICITRFEKSPLTSYSDATLLCGAKEDPFDAGSTSAKLSQLYLLDLLYVEYYVRNFEQSSLNNEKTTRAVIEKLY